MSIAPSALWLPVAFRSIAGLVLFRTRNRRRPAGQVSIQARSFSRAETGETFTRACRVRVVSDQ